MEKRPLWRRWLIDPIVAQLRQGITPERIALTIALAAVCSCFPVLGATTLLCGVVAIAFGLNQPVMQLANYLFYPAQIALLLPFYRAGETLFDQPHVPILSIAALIARFKAGPWQFVVDYGMVAVYGIVVWLLVAPLAALLIYVVLRPLLRSLARRATRLRPAG
ncbi:DUF2062 domain-containing protein [Solimonas marina]|uniref:DUF2062 domain-containing protein n=1 Tax=Solimonas marina TaxID=2714601 RepID=A0A969W7E7_9GAMM|nr:DUF2062 domain-containing protein [Solimonas marina]NKF21269.1 DUF2062 domain-containing protein [Solimonas marina]